MMGVSIVIVVKKDCALGIITGFGPLLIQRSKTYFILESSDSIDSSAIRETFFLFRYQPVPKRSYSGTLDSLEKTLMLGGIGAGGEGDGRG